MNEIRSIPNVRSPQTRDWRRLARKTTANTVVLAFIVGIAACTPSPDENATANNEADAKPVALDDTSACGNGAQVTKVDYAVKGEALLLARPDTKADEVQYKAGDTMIGASIDSSVDVRELCRKDGWSRVRLTTPQNMRSVQGWVQSAVLSGVPTSAAGKRIYGARDFDWPAGSTALRPAVITIANRIIEQNSKCDAIDRQSLTMNGSGKAATLLIACTGEGDGQSFEFTAADASRGRSFAPEKPIDPISKSDARQLCENAVNSSANHPSTVDFTLFDTTFDTFGNGRSRYSIAFSAKNRFNLELSYVAYCEFKGGELTNFVLTEK